MNVESADSSVDRFRTTATTSKERDCRFCWGDRPIDEYGNAAKFTSIYGIHKTKSQRTAVQCECANMGLIVQLIQITRRNQRIFFRECNIQM